MQILSTACNPKLAVRRLCDAQRKLHFRVWRLVRRFRSCLPRVGMVTEGWDGQDGAGTIRNPYCFASLTVRRRPTWVVHLVGKIYGKVVVSFPKQKRAGK